MILILHRDGTMESYTLCESAQGLRLVRGGIDFDATHAILALGWRVVAADPADWARLVEQRLWHGAGVES